MSIQTKEYHRTYYLEHKPQWREYNRKEYQRNHARYVRVRSTPEYKQHMREYSKEWRRKNHEKHLANLKAWYWKNRDKQRAYKKEHAARRRELYQKNILEERRKAIIKQKKYRSKARVRNRLRRATDIQYNLECRLRSILSRSLRKKCVRKSKRTMQLVGCSLDELKSHIESQFKSGMCWDKRDLFHIDHIVPISAFDLADVEEQKIAFNWKNLQPLWETDNRLKGDKIPSPLPDWLPVHIADRIRSRHPEQPTHHPDSPVSTCH